MYSVEQKLVAVQTYIKLRSLRATIRAIGYPSSREMLKAWYEEFNTTGKLTTKYKTRKPRYSDEQVKYAVDYYLQHGMNITKTCNDLGYPCRSVLSKWIDNSVSYRSKPVLKGTSMIKYSYNDKIVNAIALSCREGAAEDIIEKTGISRTSLYKWKRQLIPKGVQSNMPIRSNDNDDLAQKVMDLETQAYELKKQIHKLQLEKDALEKVNELLKKAKGINLQKLLNSEKAIIIDALRNKYCLKELLEVLKISKSSYFYQHHAISSPDKYEETRIQIVRIFQSSGNTYGYRRIHAMLKRQSIITSEKVIRRLMKEEQLFIKKVRIRKYSSYKGEITPAVPNLIKRNFHAEQPNQKWLTDITEFHLPSGKVYLSPIIDCFDGLPVSWTIGTSPSAELVNTMLDTAIEQLPDNTYPIVHSDRGSHYRWPGWITRMDNAHLKRSMSKKGCSPDNAACEAFFGRLKNEMFYCHSWNNITIDEFIEILDNYMKWYSTSRIKMSLGAMSPIEYRRSLGLVS